MAGKTIVRTLLLEVNVRVCSALVSAVTWGRVLLVAASWESELAWSSILRVGALLEPACWSATLSSESDGPVMLPSAPCRSERSFKDGV